MGTSDAEKRPVWVRRAAVAPSCPKTFVSPQSAAWVDEFFAWKTGGGGSLIGMEARTAEAFLVLEREWRTEINHE